MTNENSHLRILICTIAFGMGIDCKDLYRSIHFGSSSTVENLIQETGRLGRDGKQCFCYVLYNGLLTSHCDHQIKELVETKDCRKRLMQTLFSATSLTSITTGCICCDNCSQKCKCQDHGNIFIMSFGKKATNNPANRKFSRMRYVSNEQKKLLKEKLVNYRRSLIPATTEEFLPVGSTCILFEFDHSQIEQVLANCKYLFDMDDIVSCIDLWRNTHANMVYTILNEVFGDMDENVSLLLSAEDFEDMEVIEEDWFGIRDDTGRAELFDESRFKDTSQFTAENSQNESMGLGNENNASFILNVVRQDIDCMEFDD